MKTKVTAALFLSALLSLAFGQSCFDLLPTYMDVGGVSNEGIVFGPIEYEGTFYLWNPDTGKVTNIGGFSGGSRAQCSADGNYIAGATYTEFPSPQGQRHRGLEMARYNISTGVWTPLGFLGQGSSFATAISSDGNTVGGYAIGVNCDAVAWNESEGIINLGIAANQYTAVCDISHDGSVIVGIQFVDNRIRSAVWRKNPAGGYFPAEPILLNLVEGPDDPNYILGNALAVSGDGVWIGGIGDEETSEQPWIWSEATGGILLGSLCDTYNTPCVNGIDFHGNKVIGVFQLPNNAPGVPFIWTQENGMQNLNDYATQTLGVDLLGTTLIGVNAISDNGKYIAGIAYDPNSGGERAFRLQIGDTSTPEDVLLSAILSLSRVYPNPFTEDAKIECRLKEASQVKLSIYNQRGQLVKQLVSEGKMAGTHTANWDGRDAKGRKVSSGIYFVRLIAGKESSQKKLIYMAE